MRLVYFFAGILLIPFAMALSITWGVLLIRWWQAAPAGPGAILALAAGISAWFCLLLFLPAPTRAYVLAHEMTHAIWGAATGARLAGMRVSRAGGYVRLSERNFLSALAPYFFPFYTVMILAGYWILSWFFDLSRWRGLWLFLAGAGLGFHISFTISAIAHGQSDLREYGRIFPGAIIYCGNLLGLLLLTALLAGIPPSEWAGRLGHDVRKVWHTGAEIRRWAWNSIKTGQ